MYSRLDQYTKQLYERGRKRSYSLLPYGLEAFAPKKHTAKQAVVSWQQDEKAEVKVIEFNRNDKKIIVSHARIWEEVSALSDLKKSMDDKAAGKAAESSEGASEE
jgi:small subunit ribosomal protein S1